MTKKPEKPRAFLFGVVTAELLSDIEAEIHRIESEKSGGQSRSGKIRNSSNQTFPKGTSHD
ncbi:hypothetical protein [Paracandidimonas soli]|uniref:hypothetical protein n=1 Tax=Paracandidimonas soli TaxID=1917182 RepID=UPI0010440B4D|nr:hypothetical protein [Paracandidimonas soli]